MDWQPIETAPQDGYMLVYEDEAMRALLRIKGVWHKTGYPAIISHPWSDVIVGEDTRRFLPSGYRLELRDGCCDNPTHWMPLPAPPNDEQSPECTTVTLPNPARGFKWAIVVDVDSPGALDAIATHDGLDKAKE